MHPLSTVLTLDVKQTEDSINALYQILTYALPFIAALSIAAIGLYYKMLQAVKQNAKNTAESVRLANGQLSSIKNTVQEIQSAQVSQSTGTDTASIGAGPTAN